MKKNYYIDLDTLVFRLKHLMTSISCCEIASRYEDNYYKNLCDFMQSIIDDINNAKETKEEVIICC